MQGELLQINLFGACAVSSTVSGGFVVSGAKHRALLALLATAPFGRRTRAFLQETLWGATCYDTGRQSLRRALSDLRHIMGTSFEQLIVGSNADLSLDLSRVRFLGHVASGPFLEGLDIREPGFVAWVTGIRQNPGQLAALFRGSQELFSPLLPVVAVLPFRALDGEHPTSVLGDWIAEEICRSLSRSHLLAVISHLSCRVLASTQIDIAAVRSVLQADYCVTGTLRRLAGNLILDCDFVDTRSGQILWTRQFEQTAERFLDGSTDGIAAIVATVGTAIAEQALVYARSKVLAAIDDHSLLISGVALMHRSTLRDFARARELLEEAARRAPYTPELHAWLGKWYVLSVFNGWSADVARETRNALDCTAHALDLEPGNAFGLTIDGFAQNNLLRRLDIADARYSAALERNPNAGLSWLLKGALHAFRDEGEAAVKATERARRLSPLDPFGYFYDSLNATAHLAMGDHQRALDLADRSLGQNDRHLSTLRTKIVALHSLGRKQEAIVAGQELLRRQPDFTVSGYQRSHPAAEFEFGRNAAAALRAAGIP
ncbi:TolB amino-terminal domain-containing protein OS=Bosea thiooxidans OX=53254 GN=SAMN05660750_05020 PE=4 SV=1 [Bosea thiooxidans]